MLGLLLLLTAAVFDAEPLYVPGAAFARPGRRSAGLGRRGRARRGGHPRGRHAPCARGAARAARAPGAPGGGRAAGGRAPGRPAAASRRRSPRGATAPSSTSRPASGAGGARCSHRRGSSSGIPSASCRAPSSPAGPTSCSSCRAWSPCAARAPRTAARGPPPAAGGPPSRPRSTSTACARTATACPPRASSGPRSPAAASSWTAGCGRRGDTLPLVVLDPRAPEAEEDLDAAVRAAASLSVHLARHGGCALLLPGDRRPSGLDATLAGWTALHVRLALLGPGAGPSLGGVGSRRGPVLLVAARRDARAPRGAGAGRRRGAPARRARRAGRPARRARGRRLHGLRPRRAPRPPAAPPAAGDGDVSAPAWTRAPDARLPARRPVLVLTDADLRLLLRLAAFVPLALFGMVQWAALVHPAATGRAWVTVLAGVAAALVLLGLQSAPRGGDRRVRRAAGAALVLALVLVAVREAGVPATLLWPGHWGELRTGVSQGLDGMPSVTVPYRGSDAWIRIVDPGRRHAAGRAGGAAGLLAATGARGGVAGRRRRRAQRALRDPGGRGRPAAAVPGRRGLRGPAGPVPVARAPAGRARRRRRGDPRAGDRRGADRRAAPGRPAPVARLPGPGRRPAAARRRHLRLEPPLHAAGLAARRARGPARQGPDLELLEGDEPGRVRRGALAPGAHGVPPAGRDGGGPPAPRVAADDDRDAAQHGEPRLHHRGLGAAHPGPGARRRALRQRHVRDPGGVAQARADLPGAGLLAQAVADRPAERAATPTRTSRCATTCGCSSRSRSSGCRSTTSGRSSSSRTRSSR